MLKFAAFVMSLAIASSASARVVTYQGTADLNGYRSYDSFNLPKFDPTLGKLHGATFGATGEATIEGSWDLSSYEQPPNIIITSVTVGFDNRADVTFAPLLQIQAFNQQLALHGAAPLIFNKEFHSGEVGVIFIQSAIYSNEYITINDNAGLSLLTGIGTFANILESSLGETVFYRVEPFYIPPIGINVTVTSFVSYDYSVPEPSSWILLLSGFWLIGGQMRSMHSRRSQFKTAKP